MSKQKIRGKQDLRICRGARGSQVIKVGLAKTAQQKKDVVSGYLVWEVSREIVKDAEKTKGVQVSCSSVSAERWDALLRGCRIP